MYIDGGILVILFVIIGFICFQYGKRAGRSGYRKLSDKELAKRDAEWADTQNDGIYQMHDDKKE